MENRIREVISAIFEIKEDKIKRTSKLSDFETYDSLRFVNFLAALEEEFDCTIDFEEIQKLVSVNEVISLIKKTEN